MDRNEVSSLQPARVRGGGLSGRAALAGAGIGAIGLLVALVVAIAPAGRSAAFLGPLPASGGHHHSHHSDDGGDGGSSGDGDGVHSQSLSTDGSTQHNTGCSEVIHSLGDLDDAIQRDSGSDGAICVQMNNQSVGNSVDRVDQSYGSWDLSDNSSDSGDSYSGDSYSGDSYSGDDSGD